MLHPLVRASRSISIRVVVRALWSSSTLLCCAAKRVRTASGCGEAAAELRACARGDVCVVVRTCRVAKLSKYCETKYTPVKRYAAFLLECRLNGRRL